MYTRKFADGNYSSLRKLSNNKFDKYINEECIDRIGLIVCDICSDLCKKRNDVEGYTCIDFCNEAIAQLKKNDIEAQIAFSEKPFAGSERHAYCKVKIGDQWYDFEPQDGDYCLNKSLYADNNRIPEYYKDNSNNTSFDDIMNGTADEDIKQWKKNIDDFKKSIDDIVVLYLNQNITLSSAISKIRSIENYTYEKALEEVYYRIKKNYEKKKSCKNELNEILSEIRNFYLKKNHETVTILKKFKRDKGIPMIDISRKTRINQFEVNNAIEKLFEVGLVKIFISDEGIKFVDFL